MGRALSAIPVCVSRDFEICRQSETAGRIKALAARGELQLRPLEREREVCYHPLRLSAKLEYR
jgi:hypothetical protein